MNNFTHLDEKGNAVMVDVSSKEITSRLAIAQGMITMNEECYKKVNEHAFAKGDVLTIAQVAGIMGAKKVSELIPLCHSLPLDNVLVTFTRFENDGKYGFVAKCTAKNVGKTGVEMEALMGVNIALLTVYDMCKSIDKRMVISDIHLVEKHGGKSGDFYF